jgi:NSS family neurotransmitter:Na+ symporter
VSCAVIGVFCSLSLGDCEGLKLFGMSLLDLFDFVTGQVLLPLGGLLTCLFLGWYVPRSISYDEFTNGGTLKVNAALFRTVWFLIRYVAPVGIVVIFLTNLIL